MYTLSVTSVNLSNKNKNPISQVFNSYSLKVKNCRSRDVTLFSNKLICLHLFKMAKKTRTNVTYGFEFTTAPRIFKIQKFTVK